QQRGLRDPFFDSVPGFGQRPLAGGDTGFQFVQAEGRRRHFAQRQSVLFVAADVGEVSRRTLRGDAFDARVTRVRLPVAAGTGVKSHEHPGFAQRQNVLGIEASEHGLALPLPAQCGPLALATQQLAPQRQQIGRDGKTF
ncbi:hypothetical protein RZS08_21695, partial [Arthrospira platensis SPKY1]|nr:hypothetical protein [Arthrospira platensis SPKY1]